MSWLDKMITKDFSKWEFKHFYLSDKEEKERYRESPYYVRLLRWIWKDESKS